jgi:AcrR family transcriptional regulator
LSRKKIAISTEIVEGEARQGLRADARRNRARVLDAARIAFAEQGQDVQMEEIARRAGVGVGTIYRHFPTKEALLETLLIEKFGQVIQMLQDLEKEPNSWSACKQVIYLLVEQYLENQVLMQIVEKPVYLMEGAHTAGEALVASVSKFIERAQKSGDLRRDVTAEDVIMLVSGIMEAVNFGPKKYGKEAKNWRPYVNIFIDGLHTIQSI